MKHVSFGSLTAMRLLCRENGVGRKTLSYIEKRAKNEGLPFFTKTLPSFSAYVLNCIERGRWEPKKFTAIKLSGRVPPFGGLLCQIFDREGYPVKSVRAANALKRLRSTCEYFYKTAFSFDRKVVEEKLRSWRGIERDLAVPVDPMRAREIRKTLFQVFPKLMNARIEDILTKGNLKEGSGSFAGGITTSNYYVERLLQPRHAGSYLSDLEAYKGVYRAYPAAKQDLVPVASEKVSEVLLVPKDSRGPRVISKEPRFILKAQLGFLYWAVPIIERCSHGRINFLDQTVNQRLALEGSINRKMSTIDLKDASDRINFRFCQEVFRYSPGILYLLNRVRSTHSRLPDGSIHKLNKLAGMGSGLTFVLLSLLAYASCVQTVKRACGSLNEAMHNIYVYGDDLVVPTPFYGRCTQALVNTGFVVNQDKSYKTSYFRESCGVDAYDGVDVTPVRLKLSSASLDTVDHYRNGIISLKNQEGILQLERHCRELVKKGYNTLANYYYDCIESSGIHLPLVSGGCPILGRYVLKLHDFEAVDCTGLLPVPRKKRVATGQLDPYVYLSSHLKKCGEEDPYEFGQRTTFGVISVPRTVNFVSRKVPGFVRFGYPNKIA